MKRPLSHWIWLLTDLSLDRAAAVLPLLGFPARHHGAVQACIDAWCLTRSAAMHSAIPTSGLPESIDAPLRVGLGGDREEVDAWLLRFPFTHDSIRPDLFYWMARLGDLLLHDPVDTLPGITPADWLALRNAYHAVPPEVEFGSSQCSNWFGALQHAATVRERLCAIDRAISVARSHALSARDSHVYARMGWNDEGTQPGLASLQIGANVQATIDFWRAVHPVLPAQAVRELEAQAHARDLAEWRAAAKPEAFAADALRYGVTAERMAAEVLPLPKKPPALACLAGKVHEVVAGRRTNR